MHSNVTIKNVSWLHFSWPTLYMCYDDDDDGGGGGGDVTDCVHPSMDCDVRCPRRCHLCRHLGNHPPAFV